MDQKKKLIIILGVVLLIIVVILLLVLNNDRKHNGGNTENSEYAGYEEYDEYEENETIADNYNRIDNNEEYGEYEEFEVKSIPLPKKKYGDSEEINGIIWNYDLDEEGNAVDVSTNSSVSGEVIIPSTLDGHKVISIGDRVDSTCFAYSYNKDTRKDNLAKITSIIVPEGVLYINQYAFSDIENLTSITLPDSIIYIGDKAFSFCENLSRINSDVEGTVNMPKQLQYYGTGIFMGSAKIDKFTFPEQINYINYNTFQYSTGWGETLEIDGQFEYILGMAFSYSENIKTIKFNEGVKYINGFDDIDTLTEVYLPNSVEAIGTQAFGSCGNIEKFEYNGKLKYLGSDIFILTEVDINNFITKDQLL